MLKIVLDTNQFVSGLISKQGASARLLQAWQDNAYILITSREILQEMERVLRYPRINRKYHLTEADIQSVIDLVEREAIVLSKTGFVDVVKNDPDDNKFIACALEANADYLVSGDGPLLEIKNIKNIPMVSASDILRILEKS